MSTVSDLGDRRARKKARTRAEIRTVAQALFEEHGFEGVTIADIARGADVAVQTVFNHFANKEELFFDGRVPWVEGPAQAVRFRHRERPLAALRRYLVEITYRLLRAHESPERRREMATQLASPALQSYERELVFEARSRLAEALAEAWAADGRAAASPALTPAVTSATWVTTVSTLICEQRHRILAGADAGEVAAVAAAECDRLLADLEGVHADLAAAHGLILPRAAAAG